MTVNKPLKTLSDKFAVVCPLSTPEGIVKIQVVGNRYFHMLRFKFNGNVVPIVYNTLIINRPIGLFKLSGCKVERVHPKHVPHGSAWLRGGYTIIGVGTIDLRIGEVEMLDVGAACKGIYE